MFKAILLVPMIVSFLCRVSDYLLNFIGWKGIYLLVVVPTTRLRFGMWLLEHARLLWSITQKR